MKHLNQILIVSSFALLFSCGTAPNPMGQAGTNNEVSSVEEPTYTSDADMQLFYDQQMMEQQVMIKGVVVKNLADDNDGSRHQKFILKLQSGQTVLVAHNIDLASRINSLEEGDKVKVYGQFEWNDRGGVVHWTHHDPDGQHVGGWIEHEDVFYD